MKIVKGSARSKMRVDRSMYDRAAPGQRSVLLNPQDNSELLNVNHPEVSWKEVYRC